jgi:DNA-binding XRE family transcriptional regulator
LVNIQTSVYPTNFINLIFEPMHEVKKRYAKKLAAFGKNVRELREAKGLTQEDLAYNAGISFTTVNNLENGHLNPTLATLYAIAESLKMPLKDMVE